MGNKITFASIITTYRCNCKCHMCNVWQYPTAPEDEITPADIAKLPDVPFINITGGEPFLREDIGEILDVLRPKCKRAVISTNGYWTERILDVAARHPWIGIRVSIEGLPRANDELRGIPDGFDHGIRTLVELHHRGIRDIGFGITLSDRNAHDLMELYHLAKMMGLEFATAAVHNSYYFHKHDNTFNKRKELIGELEKLIKELLQSRKVKDWFRAYFNHGLINYIRGKPRLLNCRMGTHAFFLDPFGDIRPCNGGLDRVMGNIRHQSFDEIWNGAAAERVREEVKACRHNCWMMGSVGERMKEDLRIPLSWVIRRKFIKSRGDCVDYESLDETFTP